MNDNLEVEEVTPASTQKQYLLFYVGNDLYAIEALKAKEIVEYSQLTKVPMMQSFVKGVTNIRGNIVPVIDLLNRFGLGTTSVGTKTSIVVINNIDNMTNMHIGIMIDEVYEVDDINVMNIKDAPEFGSKIDKKYILSMGKYNNKYIVILDTKSILNIDELANLLT